MNTILQKLFTKPSEAVVQYNSILTQVVELISSRATHIAKTTRKNQYAFPLSSQGIPDFYITFCKENIVELIEALYKQFPDTRISYKQLEKSLDGRLLPPAADESAGDYIVLEWS
jgi:hypothetical protein